LRRMVTDLGLTAIHVTHDQAEAMAISDRIAVMKKGRILQVGTPEELYMRPQHVFVAHFIGESNFLEGYVTGVEGEEAIVELRGGILVRSVDKTKKKGDKVVIAVRPEVLAIERDRKKDTNTLFGDIERVHFEGTNIRYEVRLENEDMVVVVCPALREEWFSVGDKVVVSFPPEKSLIFTYPERGLGEELAVE